MYNPQLETFIKAADAGSFNKAVEELYITPTAVIKQINLLEESLGIKVFDRTHRGLILTKAGRSMYQDAKYIVQCSFPMNRRLRMARVPMEIQNTSLMFCGIIPAAVCSPACLATTVRLYRWHLPSLEIREARSSSRGMDLTAM